MKTIVSPSLLAADFTNLQADIDMINRSEADWLHCDVMDGVFVPNISFGFPVLEAVKRICTKPLDVHFMIVKPERYITRTAKLGAMMMNVHYEACTHLNRIIHEIHDEGMNRPTEKADQGQRLTGSYRSGWWRECRDSAEAQARRSGCACQWQLCVQGKGAGASDLCLGKLAIALFRLWLVGALQGEASRYIVTNRTQGGIRAENWLAILGN